MVDANDEESLAKTENAEPLGRLAVLYYGAGHMLNDITSACWFTYLLLFLTEIGLSPRLTDLGISSYGMLEDLFCVFAAIFNVGWAATQVSHMSMVNCITLNPTSRVALASCRNASTMVANLGLYAVALVVFSIYSGKPSASIKMQYRWISYFSIFVGCCFVGIFLVGTKEPELKKQIQLKRLSRIAWAHWFRKVLYYQVALVYMLTRLVTNVSQALLAFYVIDDMQMSLSSKAVVPAIIYVCSFITSVILQETRWTGWRLKAFFTAGAIVWMFSGAGIFILPSNMHNLMYILSIAIGVANALMMVTAISMQSMLVGEDLNGCAFVYGSLSFLDKISCGIALYVLESYQDPDATHSVSSQVMRYGPSINRYGLGLIPASCALLSAVVTYSMDLPDGRARLLIEPLLV